MKICMTHPTFYPSAGVVESHLLDLCGELVRQGHTVHALVGTLHGEPERTAHDGIHIHRSDLMNTEWIREKKAERGKLADEVDYEMLGRIRTMYTQFVDRYGIDVIHGHDLHHGEPGHALALTEMWKDGLPSLLTVHEVRSEFLSKDLLQRSQWDYIITFSDALTRGILEQARHLTNLRKVFPGIDTGLFSPINMSNKWVDALDLRTRPVVIHPACMLPSKGVIYSVEAMARVVREFPKALLIITDTENIVDRDDEGKGCKEEVLERIQTRGLEENVLVQPFPQTELPWVFNYCDVVLYPSIGEEPFGLEVVEGMACAKPVVVTRNGGMVESVVDGETGFIVEKRDSEALAEKILMLLKDMELAAQMGQRGRERAVKLFTRERMAHETASLYGEAMERGKARARFGRTGRQTAAGEPW